jgi:transposase-like protein
MENKILKGDYMPEKLIIKIQGNPLSMFICKLKLRHSWWNLRYCGNQNWYCPKCETSFVEENENTLLF